MWLLENLELYAPERVGARSLLIGGGKLLRVLNPGERAPDGWDVELVDCGGRCVVPGFVDTHVHITGGGGESGARSKVPALQLSRYTRCGVTSVVGLLGTDDTTRSTAELLARARGLEEEGLSAWIWTGGYHLPPMTLTGSVRGDIVHLDRCVGVGEIAISDHRSSQPSEAEFLRLAADAHVAGLMTGKAGVLHLHLGDGLRGLELVRRALDISEIPARVFHPTHVNRKRRLFEEALEVARRGVTIDVTAYPVEKGEDAWSAEDAFERFMATGIARERFTVSSDGGGCLPVFDSDGRVTHMDVGAPDMLAATLRMLLHRGHALETVLPILTSNPARLLRLENKGHLREGADADLIVLDHTGLVRDVMARGVWHLRDGQQRIKGSFES
jgi:beta-aspartyl-dipeptidase (metallo-type)